MKNIENIRSFRDKYPDISKTAFIDKSAILIGDVRLGENCSVWPGAVIRADEGFVEIDKNSAIMDKAFLESPEGADVKIGKDVLISHGAIIHGCEIGDGTLVGMGAIIFDNAKIGENCLIGAGTVVPKKEIPSESFVIGMPGEVKGEVTVETLEKTKELKKVHEKAMIYKKQKKRNQAE